ncbi:MAG TPA: radical SAM family heme chaperone HemW [Candidatus Binatia bacterium]|nr:radical SAM family heme chaperone HemW [Candidatus Binatia bacterium]
MSDAFGLYVHVPYCRHVCPYCDFNVQAARVAPEQEYVDGLERELAAHARDPLWAGRPVRTIFLGGGTPSLFSPAAVARILAAVGRRFAVARDAEVTLEANPGTVSRSALDGYRVAGVNRLSLGAQSFDAGVLATLGRDHAVADVGQAVGAARDAGFENVSLDLIYAVPGETVAVWERDLAAAIALAPEHVSAYALTYEEGTPYAAWRASGRLTPVAEDDEATMAELALVRLEAAGLRRYEISSWARPGREARHNLGYWDGSDYLGVGAGAHSFSRTPAPGRRWMNERPPARWLAGVAERGTAIATDERLTERQARGEFVVTGLRRIAGVDADAFARRFGTRLDAAFPELAALADDGLVEPVPGGVRLSRRGLLFADTVAARLV